MKQRRVIVVALVSRSPPVRGAWIETLDHALRVVLELGRLP